MITNIINRGDRPLFNRKYLLALVWLLPLAIVALSRLTPNGDVAVTQIAENQLWMQSERNGFNIYFSQGSGLTSTDKARQALLLEGLELRLASPEIEQLLDEQHWVVRPQVSSLTTQLQIDAKEPVTAQVVQQLIELLQQPPAIDWVEPIERITAQTYLAGQKGRQRALDALLSSVAPEPLAPRTYVELVDRPISLLFIGEQQPEPVQVHNSTEMSDTLQGKIKVSVRAQQSATLLLWRLDAPTSAVAYLAQQALGTLVSTELSRFPNMRLQQQLSPEGSLLLLEASRSEEELTSLLQSISTNAEKLEAAISQLEQRWQSAITQRPEAWAEALLLYSLEPQSLTSAFESLREDAEDEISQILQQLQQPASRRARLFTATSS